ncbi:MAG TPA: ATP-dependent sacrificial sulfur transferase LarE [Spirochaetota bacterium]|nr:ATP-dependent sacrificial sulfur transferase LarE [Spirochaetota bacterium]HPV43649.1 ATP-dependent sacrificial sulfur transferase LarE [Spirochaetota bacterium]
MNNSLQKKLDALYSIIDSLGTVAVAFSGGVDSAFLLKTAHDRLGRGAVAVTVDSPLIAPDEIEAARSFTASEGISHEIIFVDIFKNGAVIANPPDRCYHCKIDVFRAIAAYASSQGISHIAEGSNLDDRDDYRPGFRAIRELSVLSPLMDAGFAKDDVRNASRSMGLAAWDKPANPCLATRIPCGTAITKEMLETVYRAEEYLHGLGIRDVRVRHHGSVARIEAPREEQDIILQGPNAAAIADAFKRLGFAHIALDIEGYRRGSMNEPASRGKGDGQG